MSERNDSTDAVTMTRSGAVAIVCMNRPRRLNVLSIDLLGRLNEVLVSAASEPAVRVVILKGAGRSFSAGGDLAVIAALHGSIAGGGFSLAIACDLAIASQDATFLSAYTRLGTNPDGQADPKAARAQASRRRAHSERHAFSRSDASAGQGHL